MSKTLGHSKVEEKVLLKMEKKLSQACWINCANLKSIQDNQNALRIIWKKTSCIFRMNKNRTMLIFPFFLLWTYSVCLTSLFSPDIQYCFVYSTATKWHSTQYHPGVAPHHMICSFQEEKDVSHIFIFELSLMHMRPLAPHKTFCHFRYFIGKSGESRRQYRRQITPPPQQQQ